MISNKTVRTMLRNNNFDHEKTYLDIKKHINYRPSDSSKKCFNCTNFVKFKLFKCCRVIGEMPSKEACISENHICDCYKLR